MRIPSRQGWIFLRIGALRGKVLIENWGPTRQGSSWEYGPIRGNVLIENSDTYGAPADHRSRHWSSGHRAPSSGWRDRTPDRRGRAVPRLSHPDSRRTCRTVSCLRSIRSTRGNGMMTGLNKEKTDILVECFSNRHTGRKPIRLLLYTSVSLIF